MEPSLPLPPKQASGSPTGPPRADPVSSPGRLAARGDCRGLTLSTTLRRRRRWSWALPLRVVTGPANSEPRPYWSERHGRGPRAHPLDLEGLKRLAFNVLDDLEEKGYFQQAFGYWCVDAGAVSGSTGSDPNAWFLRMIGRDDIWPYREHGSGWDEDTLFDVVEVLHDLCAEGTDGFYHNYNDCGMHYLQFDPDSGSSAFREAMNPVLRRYERPLELAVPGRLREAAPSEFQQLLDADVPPGTDADLITSRMGDAVDLFRSRAATVADRRRAVRDLADVLEPLRADIREHALPKDEQELFRLANGFAIRHNNREQLRHYDDVVWLRWAFYVYLATIHAVLRLRDRQQQQPSA
jgi:hypothetical protein